MSVSAEVSQGVSVGVRACVSAYSHLKKSWWATENTCTVLVIDRSKNAIGSMCTRIRVNVDAAAGAFAGAKDNLIVSSYSGATAGAVVCTGICVRASTVAISGAYTDASASAGVGTGAGIGVLTGTDACLCACVCTWLEPGTEAGESTSAGAGGNAVAVTGVGVEGEARAGAGTGVDASSGESGGMSSGAVNSGYEPCILLLHH